MQNETIYRFPQVILANEVVVSGRSEDEVYAFIDKITSAMVNTIKAGLAVQEDVLPGPIKTAQQSGHRLQTSHG